MKDINMIDSCQYHLLVASYLHFQSKPLINLFATVYNLMKDINMIDSCQYHLLVAELSETQNYAYWYTRFFPGTHVFG